MTKPTTSKEYAKNGGGFCPACGSREFSADPITVQGKQGYSVCFCKNCTSQWTEVYELTGYNSLVVHKRDD